MTTTQAAEPRTTTELAAQLADDPRFRDTKNSGSATLFNELAARYGANFVGVAFIQAALKIDQQG